MKIQPVPSAQPGGDIFSRYKQQQKYLNKFQDERDDRRKDVFQKIYRDELERLGG